MNYKESQFLKIKKPEIKPNESYKKRLRTALLLAHGNKSIVQMFSNIIINSINNMTTMQKRITFSSLALVGLVVMAGTIGPSAASIAHAEAQDIVGRAFAHFNNLTDEQRTELEKNFQDKIQFKQENHFIGMKDISPEEIEKMHETMKASLVNALAEAQAAPDLQVISADKMPTPGFIGKAGRAFGFGMMRSQNFEERLASLPEDIRQHIEEREAFRAEMHPVSFLVYTNSDDQIVHLGVNADNEPVMKFVKSENGKFFPFDGRMMRFKEKANRTK